jgi:hypothetical protein
MTIQEKFLQIMEAVNNSGPTYWKGENAEKWLETGLKKETALMQQVLHLLESPAFLTAAGRSEMLNIGLVRSSVVGHIDLVDLFLAHGADIETNNGSPLREAAINDRPNVVDLLLKRGANPRSGDDAPLFGAISSGSENSITSLMKTLPEKDLEELKTKQFPKKMGSERIDREAFLKRCVLALLLVDAELETRRKRAARTLRASAEELTM